MTATLEGSRIRRTDRPLLENLSDEALLARYRDEHDRAAFETLVHRYERELFSYLRRYLGDSAAAEDVFQATFLQVHLNCGQFQDERKVRAWLYTIATNQAIDAQRRNKRHKVLSLDRRHGGGGGEEDLGTLLDLLTSQEANPLTQLETEERRQWVRGAVEALPEMLRTAVVLVVYQGLKYSEAAEIVGTPVGTMKSRVHSAVLRLHEAWKRDFGSGEK